MIEKRTIFYVVFLIYFLNILHFIEGTNTAVDDWFSVTPDTPQCLTVLSNDIYTGATPSLTLTTDGTSGGFSYTSFSPFFMVPVGTNTAVIEAENYQQMNFRGQSSYNTLASSNSWEVVTSAMYPNLTGGGIRVWPPNLVTSTSFVTSTGPAMRYDIAFRTVSSAYRMQVRAQACAGCISGNCTGCDTGTVTNNDNSIHYMTDPNGATFVSTNAGLNAYLPYTCTWAEFVPTFSVGNAYVTWPPTPLPVWLAMREDGIVVDKFIVTISDPLPSNSTVPAATQFVNCGVGEVVYFPPQGFTGVDTITYTINDGTGASTGQVTLYIGVSPSPSISPSSIPNPSPSPTPSITPTRSITPSKSPSVTPSISVSSSPSTSPIPPSPSQSSSRTPSPSPVPSASSSVSPVSSSTPSSSPNTTPTNTPPPVQFSPSASSSPDGTDNAGGNKGGKSGSLVPVIGGVVGGVVLLATVAALLLFLIKRRKHRKDAEDGHTTEMSAISGTSGNEVPRYAEISIKKVDSETAYAPIQTALTPSEQRPSSINQEIKDSWVINYSEIKITKKLGEGAYGVVWEGKWKGSHVAVKKLIPTDNQTHASDFFAEAELMKKLRPHPNVVAMLGVCQDPLCLVTEFVANGDLWSLLQKGPLEDDMKQSITQGIATGMFYLHQQGVIHRDLAARNILLDKNFTPKVSDFGMSRVAMQETGQKTSSEVGPIRWMAPEALSERMYNAKTDVWSFGVVIYEILVRKLPYNKIDLAQVAARVAMGKASLTADITAEKEELPQNLVSVMALCLKFNADDRPDFSKIVDMLE